ncbi:uncharacterized protein CANTADRAFT_97104 [Suhomyces tanzawaensis NRRL Y-17324]|uniref:Uncharacterized protein n=1 Tax=Suhomyces tanzawaensis NRRL Y-17324 TaxID=984487 RepID=A0A1E4SD83_9ASCO|nr:uncharacterized protein CANTADRAFT_97104 [Suhomyces tanzawaensis NRRL Y-17324]ODV77443.1 hypothetical protein CANTADRAFT_97104 [Suhomyces tanzawaensis NRRL Y-17324]
MIVHLGSLNCTQPRALDSLIREHPFAPEPCLLSCAIVPTSGLVTWHSCDNKCDPGFVRSRFT